MALTRYDFFYDNQVERYLMQVVRAFSGFQYMTGDRGEGKPKQLRIVPCVPAKRNRQVAAIQRNMSENTLLSVPMISVDITNFEPDRERMQNPNHVSTVQVTERARDSITGEYTEGRGNSVTIDRLMPRPYMLSVQVDIWTSNMQQKLMLLEQIDNVIFPGFDIQNSDNALDWSALTTAQFESQTFTSLSVPIGTENEIDVATINLKIPMWLSPPAKVTRQNIIQQVITNVNEGEKDEHGVLIPTANLQRIVSTPGDHCLRVQRGVLTLLGPTGQEFTPAGEPYSWDALLAQYSAILRPGETQVRLRSTLSEDTTNDVVGVLFATNEGNVVEWQPDIDTLPSNTLIGVNGVINPLHSIPGEGAMPPVQEGQRYLLIEDIAGFANGDHGSAPQTVWDGIQARAGSIIQYQNGKWRVSFDSIDHQQIEYVTNRNTGRQLVWNVEEQSWVMALDAVYGPGYWRLGTI
jgi:hypothetical protein